MNRPMRYIAGVLAVLWCAVAAAQVSVNGDLPRRAEPGFEISVVDARLVVRSVDPESPAARAGLRESDRIVAIDGKRFERDYVGRDFLRRLRGGTRVRLTVERNGRERALSFVPADKPWESLVGVDIEYGTLDTADGARLRTIITRPGDREGALPAFFFVQWVSCDSVEIDRPGVWLNVMRGVIETSGLAFIRVERGSGGDSDGPACHELDFDTELAHYRYAFDRVTKAPGIDPERIIIWGNSLGATMAPLVADGKQVYGMIVDGGGAQTFVERMIQFDRIGLENSASSDIADIDSRMRRHVEFHVEYLLRGKDPDEIELEFPHLADVWNSIRGTGDGIHYGRPYDWHRQAAAHDFLAAWSRFEGRALVLYHEYDQFEYGEGHRIIADVLNRLRPGSADYVVLPAMGHDFRIYTSRFDAVAGRSGNPASAFAAETILRWLERVGLRDHGDP